MDALKWMKTDEALNAHLGRMIRQAATLELYLEQTVKVLCGGPYGALLISGESTSRVIDACRALVKVHHALTDEWREEFNTVLSDAKQAFERRNRYVHGAISWQGEVAVPGNSRSRRLKLEAEFVPLDLDDLVDLTSELNRLTLATGSCLRAALDGFPDHLAEDYSDD
ncbi:hypothetical protein [Streptomyces sp. NPDC091212]|uniref:hypothetical protein n=1 Tax=Streptomyces sp. NPDC091212 TaxID=3155191 RepID=UPI0034241372